MAAATMHRMIQIRPLSTQPMRQLIQVIDTMLVYLLRQYALYAVICGIKSGEFSYLVEWSPEFPVFNISTVARARCAGALSCRNVYRFPETGRISGSNILQKTVVR